MAEDQSGLVISGLSVAYRGAGTAISGIDLKIGRGEIVGIWGPNGAGKTTLLSALAGTYLGAPWRITAGTAVVNGSPILGNPAHKVRRAGISLIDGRDNVFANLSVTENLKVLGSGARHETNELERVWEWFPQLARIKTRLAGHLSGGERQMLAVARGVMGSPTVLLADEISNGLSPKMVSDVLHRLITLAREEGMSLLVAEQQMHLVADAADRSYVLRGGRITAEFGADGIEEASLLKSYFGEPAAS